MALELSNEAIEKGAAVLMEYCPDSAVGDKVDREMVGSIFHVMSDRQSNEKDPSGASTQHLCDF